MTNGRGGLAILALGLAAAWLGGCVSGEMAGVKAKRGSERVGYAMTSPDAKAASQPKNRYLELRAKKGKVGAQGALVMPCDMWMPFRWEVTGGVFDPDYAAQTDGAILGTELDGRGSWPPTIYYGISAQYTGGGLNAYAYTHNSSSPIGSHYFAGVTRLEFAIEADGANIMFYARPKGSSSWTTLGTYPLTNQTVPLNPAMGVFNMDSKGRVGFDDFRLVTNGVSPTPLSSQQTVARLIWESSVGIVGSMHGLDGAKPNFGLALTDLPTSITGLNAAVTACDAITDDKIRKKAKNYIEKAIKKTTKAHNSAEDQNAKKAIDRLQSASKYLLKAINKLDPQD
jgi:hypothetical protein